MDKYHNSLINEITVLKKQNKAIILVHNYQKPEIYKVADLVGDSFELAKKASEIKDAKIIIFCGVDFMAESAAILNPDKEVYLPAIEAKCPMAAMVDPEGLVVLKKKHPKAATVCYINTSADVKAVCDVVVTSSNAVRIVKKLPNKEIIFVPDKNLAAYVQSQVPEKKIIPWEGYCYVHNRFNAEEARKAKEANPDAVVIAHPECPQEVLKYADHICSTSAMITITKECPAKKFIILTEVGMVERLKIEVPGKIFLTPMKTCIQMKKNSLEKVRDSLLLKQHLITVDEETANKAKNSLYKMLEMAK